MDAEEQRAEANRHAARLGLRITEESRRGRVRVWETAFVACGHDGGQRTLSHLQHAKAGRICEPCAADEARRQMGRLGLVWVGVVKGPVEPLYVGACAAGHELPPKNLRLLRNAQQGQPCRACATAVVEARAAELGWRLAGQSRLDSRTMYHLEWAGCGHPVAQMPMGNFLKVSGMKPCRACFREEILALIQNRPGITFVRWETEDSTIAVVACAHGHQRRMQGGNVRRSTSAQRCWCASHMMRSRTLAARLVEVANDPALVLDAGDIELLRKVVAR